ncbi:hypothetical protein R0J87_18690, partial [Halomonas sp. SIMBA_159]
MRKNSLENQRRENLCHLPARGISQDFQKSSDKMKKSRFERVHKMEIGGDAQMNKKMIGLALVSSAALYGCSSGAE